MLLVTRWEKFTPVCKHIVAKLIFLSFLCSCSHIFSTHIKQVAETSQPWHWSHTQTQNITSHDAKICEAWHSARAPKEALFSKSH